MSTALPPMGGGSGKKACQSLKGIQAAMKRGTQDKEALEEEKLKSLRIRSDDRYEKMEYYRNHGGTSATTGHFARVCGTNRKMRGLAEEKKAVNADNSLAEIAELEMEEPVNDWEKRAAPVNNLQNRVAWNEEFDRAVKRLFVDFELTDVPSSRLAHLDRMHQWFEEHGAKQTRKSEQGPSYLKAERSGKMPPGSTKNIANKLTDTSLVLLGNYVSGSRSPNSRSPKSFGGVVPS
eukprot:TRINITY_DN51479_c0_g1_i1.p1 TRINITY_DN51479_c0_g1~~TRINITY_DN51479_c0_g1_i1.p1  ORF type:complete len:269 (+),score=47.90 TRINITY_DN51479_c0_g1_i1:103-807(+)